MSGPEKAGLRARTAATLTDAGFAAGWRAVRMLPEPAARTAFDRAGRWAAGRDGKGVRQLRANLRVVTGGALTEPELDALTARAVRSYARYWQEAFRLPTLSRERIVTGTEVVGLEHVRAGARRGPRPGHGPAAQRQLGRGGGLVRRLARRPVHDRRRAAEARVALPALPRVPGVAGHAGRPADRRAAAELGGPARVAGRRRRDLSAGRPRTSAAGVCRSRSSVARRPCPAGPALLAAQTGAALIPIVCSFTDARLAAAFTPRCRSTGRAGSRTGSATAMQAVADAFATTIAERPEDWHMLGRIWSDVPPDPPRAGRRLRGAGLMRIGLVCPYQWDVPGGVQYHVRDLAETLRDLGHHVEILTPAEREESLPRARSPSPGARCPCRTTARWPACSSARSRRPGCAAGCATGTSTSSTCTSRRRRRSRCWSA